MNTPKLPALLAEAYLVQMAEEIGIYDATWQEVAGWQQATNTPLSAWEAGAVRRISGAYSSAVREYQDKDAPPPWHDGKVDVEIVTQQARNAFRRSTK
jgi:hypothetical protein